MSSIKSRSPNDSVNVHLITLLKHMCVLFSKPGRIKMEIMYTLGLPP